MLSEERQRRLEELRARYPKQEPQAPELPRQDAYLTISLRFEFQTHSQEEADRAAFQCVWNKAHDLTELLHHWLAKDGLRGIGFIQEVRGRQTEPIDEPTLDDDLYPLDIEDMRESDLQN